LFRIVYGSPYRDKKVVSDISDFSVAPLHRGAEYAGVSQ
jgi:hypothetical protein